MPLDASAVRLFRSSVIARIGYREYCSSCLSEICRLSPPAHFAAPGVSCRPAAWGPIRPRRLDVARRLGPWATVPGLCWRISDEGYERRGRQLGPSLFDWKDVTAETPTRRWSRETPPEGLMGINHQYVIRQRFIYAESRASFSWSGPGSLLERPC